MNKALSRAILAIMIVAFLLVLSFQPNKTIILEIDGNNFSVETSAITLYQFLREENLAVREEDQISPHISSWLNDGDTVSIQQSMQVFIQVDGIEQTILTTQRKPAEFLQEANITINPEDVVLTNGQEVSADKPLSYAETYSLQIIRPSQISIVRDEKIYTVYSTAATLGQALWEQGISLLQGDILDPPPTTPLESVITQVGLESSHEFVVHSNDNWYEFRTTAKSIAEGLAENGIPLQGQDYTSPPAENPIPEDRMVSLVRVEEIITIETETIPFPIEYQPQSDLEIDNQTIVEAGQFGLAIQRLRTRLEDGEPVMHQVEDKFITKHPQPRIIGYGTMIVPRTLDTPDGSYQYWRALDMYAVSYNPTSAGGTITASGLPLRKGLVAVDPRYIPLGTRLYVPSYGEALAADTGGGVHGRIIDLGYSDDDYEHWSRNVTVYFLWPPPENIAWIIP